MARIETEDEAREILINWMRCMSYKGKIDFSFCRKIGINWEFVLIRPRAVFHVLNTGRVKDLYSYFSFSKE